MAITRKILNPNTGLAILIIAMGLVFSLEAVNKPLSDWGNYYYGSSFLVKGEFSRDIYEPYKFNLMVRQQGETDIFLNYTPIPPFTALFYVPFQLASSGNSKLVFNILSVLIFAIAAYRLSRFLGINSYWLLAIPFALLAPFRSNIFFGQTYLLIIAMLAEGYISYRNDKKILAAILWSAAILLKLFPGIILLYLLFKKDYKTLGITLGIMLMISAVTAAVMGFGLNAEYFTHIMPRMFNNEINDTYASSYQSLLVLLNKLFIYDKLLNPRLNVETSLTVHMLVKSLNLLYSLAVLYICAMYTLKRDHDDYLKFSLWILAGLLVTGYGSGYSLLLLIFISFAVIKTIPQKKVLAALITGCIFLISSVPVLWFAKLPVLLQFPRLYLLVIFFIVIIIILNVRIPWKYIYIIPAAAVVLLLLNLPGQVMNGEYVLNKEEALLIYDYSSSNGKLKINFIDQNGRNEKELAIPFIADENKNAVIEENQVYYNGAQMTNSPDNKLLPKVSTGGEIYYLSDKNRGVGFYTLRSISIPK